MRNFVIFRAPTVVSAAVLAITTTISASAMAESSKSRHQNASTSPRLAQANSDIGFVDEMQRSFGLHRTERERRTKTIELLGGGDSAITPSVFGGGTGVIGYYVTPDLVVDVGLRMALGIRPFNFSNLFDGQAAYEGTGAIRYFLGKSFYSSFGGGIGLYEATHKENKSTEFQSWKESVMIWRPYFGIGNQWHLKTWTVMIEWVDIGYHVGLSKVKDTLPTGSSGGRPETSEASSLSKVPGSLYIGSKLLIGFAF